MAQDSSSKVPIFDGSDYAFWEVMMKTYLLAINVDFWASVVNGYKVPNTLPIDPNEKRKYETNMKAKFSILNSLSKDVFVKVMHCSSSKEVWDKLKNTYHGNDRVKEAKIQHLKSRFEDLKMGNDEKVEDYLLKIDETVNGIRGLGEKIDDIDVVKKVLRSLPDKFDSKICSIEETRDINKYTMEDIHGALVAYEMRKFGK